MHMTTTTEKHALNRALQEMHCWPLNELQKEWIPRIEEGKDCFLQAETGTGKTIAFLYPLLNRIDPEDPSTQLLVLSPTRELALQTAKCARDMTVYTDIHTVGVVGGLNISHQVNALRYSPHAVIGTPGRILDLLDGQNLFPDRLKAIVMDEGDLILSTGQKDTVQTILGHCPDCQRICVSATYHEAAAEWLRDGFTGLSGEQAVRDSIRRYVLRAEDRFAALTDILAQSPVVRAIVFTSYKSTANTLADQLAKQGVLCAAFSGYYEEKERLKILKEFRTGKVRVLIATDAAARGLDIRGISHIIHYDVPRDYETYIHRSGRTARQKDSGTAVSILTEEDIVTETGARILAESTPIPLDEGIHTDLSSPLAEEEGYAPAVTRLFIRKGRKDKIRPKDILGALCTVLPFEEIGAIEIQDNWTSVTVRNTDPDLLSRLEGLTVKGKRVRIERRND